MTLTRYLVLVFMLALAGVSQAQVDLESSVVSAGGGTSSSAGTQMSFTVGQPAVGFTTSNLYSMEIGFWVPHSGDLTPVTETLVPGVFSLDQNYPNPFNPMTVINFSLPEDAPVNLSIYNVRGERVRQLLSEDRTAGSHQVTWDGTDDFGQGVSSGTYLARIESSVGIQNIKMLLAR